MNPPARANVVVGLSVGVWVVAAASGFLLWGAYHATPGDPGSPRRTWPTAARVPLGGARPTLLIFLNPGCPCSIASVAELAQLVGRNPGAFEAHVLVHRSTGDDAGAGIGRLDARLAAIPGLRRWDDREGVEASRLGVETSGHVLLYDPSGRLRFSGGITLGRGQMGENPGLDRLIASIRDRSGDPREGPVFGCPVFDSAGLSGEETVR